LYLFAAHVLKLIDELPQFPPLVFKLKKNPPMGRGERTSKCFSLPFLIKNFKYKHEKNENNDLKSLLCTIKEDCSQ
jgi:hypothetical protein